MTTAATMGVTFAQEEVSKEDKDRQKDPRKFAADKAGRS